MQFPHPDPPPLPALWKFKEWLSYIKGGERDLQPWLINCLWATDQWPPSPGYPLVFVLPESPPGGDEAGGVVRGGDSRGRGRS